MASSVTIIHNDDSDLKAKPTPQNKKPNKDMQKPNLQSGPDEVSPSQPANSSHKSPFKYQYPKQNTATSPIFPKKGVTSKQSQSQLRTAKTQKKPSPPKYHSANSTGTPNSEKFSSPKGPLNAKTPTQNASTSSKSHASTGPMHHKPYPSNAKVKTFTTIQGNNRDAVARQGAVGYQSSPFRSVSSAKPAAPSNPSDVNYAKMVKIVNISLKKIVFSVAGDNKGLDSKKLKALLKFVVRHVVKPHRDGQYPKHVSMVQLNLAGNILDDSCIPLLVGFFRHHAEYMSIKVLKLYQNKIGDKGVEAFCEYLEREDSFVFQEIHLSHNRISTKGALRLMNAISNSSKYPYRKENEKNSSPLWLRLEHNFICSADCEQWLKQAKTPYCMMTTKGGVCSPTNCIHDNTKIHLVYLQFQYWNEDLELTKNSLLASAAILKGASLPESMATPSTTGSTSTSSASSSKIASIQLRKDESHVHNIVAGPLYLFMDTNAVVTAILETYHAFSFFNIAKKFDQANFGTKDTKDISNRVILVVTDTVLGELDGMIKKHIIKSSTATGFLKQAEDAGYLIMLGSHQGEKIVHALEGSFSGGDGLDVTTSNDRMIVDISLMLAEELGDVRCVMFISEDRAARLTARNRGLCTISMSQISELLKKDQECWNAPYLRHMFLEAAPIKSGVNDTYRNPISVIRSFKGDLIKFKEQFAGLEVKDVEAKLEMQQTLENMIASLNYIAILPNGNVMTRTIGHPEEIDAEGDEAIPAADEIRTQESGDDPEFDDGLLDIEAKEEEENEDDGEEEELVGPLEFTDCDEQQAGYTTQEVQHIAGAVLELSIASISPIDPSETVHLVTSVKTDERI